MWVRVLGLLGWVGWGAGCAVEHPRGDAGASGTQGAASPFLDTAGPFTTVDTGVTGDTSAEGSVAFWGEVADRVIEASGASKALFRDPSLSVNGVRGGGTYAGGTDVFALGFDEGQDDALVVGWEGRRVMDGPGDDLVVFENSFATGHDTCFMDLVVVSVSADGMGWATFPVDYVAQDESVYSDRVEDWHGFAGRMPVRLHEEDNRVDPFDAELAGGDGFDLADLAPSPETDAVLEHGVWAVRLQSAATVRNPDTGESYVRDPIANGPDIDGVYGRYLMKE